MDHVSRSDMYYQRFEIRSSFEPWSKWDIALGDAESVGLTLEIKGPECAHLDQKVSFTVGPSLLAMQVLKRQLYPKV